MRVIRLALACAILLAAALAPLPGLAETRQTPLSPVLGLSGTDLGSGRLRVLAGPGGQRLQAPPGPRAARLVPTRRN